ncbi:MAG: hypothetical protein KBT09_03725 [Bacteroidales bacterium]|nr:hypothetical protein [Candidatus Sodaliphilus fimicaballi]
MKWTCDKCGKEMELSQEQLVETGGAVVCPQCLTSAVVPGFSSRRDNRTTSHTTPSNPIPPIPPKTMASNSNTPPARRQTISFVETPTRTTPPPHHGRGKTATTPPAHTEPPTKPQPKKKSGKKNSKTGLLNPPGPLGCLLRTVWYTAILLAVYLLMGLVLGM